MARPGGPVGAGDYWIKGREGNTREKRAFRSVLELTLLADGSIQQKRGNEMVRGGVWAMCLVESDGVSLIIARIWNNAWPAGAGMSPSACQT